MENSRWQKNFLLQLSLSITSLMILFPLTHAYQPCISTCLETQDVTNFTLYPKNNVDPSLYYNLLDYSIRNARFAESSVPKPAAIVLPCTKEQLVNAVLCSRQCSLEIRVRCGGHSYEGTSSVATDGISFIIIDLINLDQVSVDLESKTAWVEGGATLGQTYYAISKATEMLGFPAGSCPTVGIGGHISGGGFGLLSRKYGLAADNVVDALLVNGKGLVLDRNAMGEDVFWAIRGGDGGVWGIVYAWKIRLVEVPKVVTGFIVSRHVTRHNAAKLVHKWQLVAPMLEGNFYLSCVLGATLPKGKTVARISPSFTGYYLGPKAEALAILNRVFLELGLKEHECKEMSWIESVVYYSGLDSVFQLKDRLNHNSIFFKAKSDYVKTVIPRIGIRSAMKMLEKEPKGYVILDPYGGVMEEISSESIAFPHRKGNLFSIQYMVTWQKEDNVKSKEYMEWIRDFYNKMTPYVSKSPREAYINYMDLDLGQMDGLEFSRNAVEKARAWGEKYFLSNYDRLVQAKTSIDPHNIFRHHQGIPPLQIQPK